MNRRSIRKIILALTVVLAPTYAATLPPPWGALSTGIASSSGAGVFETWILANSFEPQSGLSEAIMAAAEHQVVTTQLIGVGTGTLEITGSLTFTGSNLAPGHPYDPRETDVVSVGGGWAIPVVLEQAVLDDAYSVALTATARTHGDQMTDSESDSGSPIASTSATAVAGPTPGGSPGIPFTTFFYFSSITVSINGAPPTSLFSGSLSLDSQGTLHTSGDVSPANFTATPGGFTFSAPIDFTAQLTSPNESFTFDYESFGDLLTVATPEPATLPILLALLALASAVHLRKRALRNRQCN